MQQKEQKPQRFLLFYIKSKEETKAEPDPNPNANVTFCVP